MILTAIIYTILWLIVYFALSKVEANVNHCRKENSKFWTWGVASALIIASLVKGLSEDMGTDYYAYADTYNRIANSTSLTKDYEMGYLFLNKVLAFFGMDLPWIFIVNSFIVFFFIILFCIDFP